LVGETAFASLVEFRGGRSVFIPSVYRPDHWLSGLIGEAASLALIDHFGGNAIRIPLNKQGLTERLMQTKAKFNQEILALSRAGLGTSAICARLGVSEKYVRRVKRLATGERPSPLLDDPPQKP